MKGKKKKFSLIAILQDFARVRRAEVEERLAREEAAPPSGSGEKHTVQFNMATIAPYDEASGRQAKPGKENMPLLCDVDGKDNSFTFLLLFYL
jgi:hypothetical protein